MESLRLWLCCSILEINVQPHCENFYACMPLRAGDPHNCVTFPWGKHRRKKQWQSHQSILHEWPRAHLPQWQSFFCSCILQTGTYMQLLLCNIAQIVSVEQFVVDHNDALHRIWPTARHPNEPCSTIHAHRHTHTRKPA